MSSSCPEDDLIAALRLHGTLGGFFRNRRELFRSVVKSQASKQRNASSSALFLLRKDALPEIWYQLRTDELLVHHAGASLTVRMIHPDGACEEQAVGPDILSGELPQCFVPAWTWRRLLLPEDGKSSEYSWGLYGSFVSPGFDPADYSETAEAELGKRVRPQGTTEDFISLPEEWKITPFFQ